MPSAIDPVDLPRHLTTYGTRATVITVTDGGRPHVGTSTVELDGDRLWIDVGPRAAGYLAQHPDLCLTWPPVGDEQYQLIVDGTAAGVEPHGDTFRVAVAVRTGIRHRVADAPATGPTCIPLDHGR